MPDETPLPFAITIHRPPPIGDRKLFDLTAADHAAIAMIEGAPHRNPQPQEPPPPPLTIFTPKDAQNRGTGVQNQSLSDAEVRGFEQNITVGQRGAFAFRNVRTYDAWRDRQQDAYEGQGFYLGEQGNDVVMQGVYGARNGWREGKPFGAKNMFRHGLYANENGSLVLEDFIFSENAACGAQIRRVAKVRRGFLHRNSIGLLALMGAQEWEDIVIYGTSYYLQGGNWIGAGACDIYSEVRAKNLTIVGEPNARPPGSVPGASVFNMGAIKLNRTHDKFRNTPGGKLTVTDGVISGWIGKPFGGDAMPDGGVPGFRISDKTVDADKDVRLILADLEANKLPNIAAARQRLSDRIRSAI